jgi:hypothetical protein
VTYRFTRALATRAPAYAGAISLVLASTACASLAHADERPREATDTWSSARWETQPVRYPVDPAEVQPAAPRVPAHAGTVTGVIEIGPTRAAALWLDALDVVRVRSATPVATTTATPEGTPEAVILLRRIVGTPAGDAARTRGEIEESPALAVPGLWYVAQPPERGDVWVIAATAPMRVVIERPVWRDDARAWEDARSAVLHWIEDGGAMPALPPGPDSLELALGLRADHALAELLIRSRPDAHGFGQAVRDWRSASALTRMAIAGAHRQPYHWFEDRTAALAAGPGKQLVSLASESRPYARTAEELTWSAALEGSGVLELDVRALLPEQSQREDGTGLLRVAVGDRVLVERRYPRRPAYVASGAQPPDPAWPQRAPLRAPDGLAAGPRERVRVPLLPGKHTYRVALSGGQSLVRARVVRRRSRLIEALRGRANPGDFIAAARDALAGDHTPEAAVLAQLLAELEGSTTDAAPRELSPLLALVADVSRRRGRAVDRDVLHALIEQARPVLEQAPPDVDPALSWPALSWMLRRDLVEMAARADAPEAIDALTRDMLAREPVDVPPIVAARIAELVVSAPHDGPDAAPARAWALRAVQRAWRAEPLQPSIRQTYLRVWRQAPPWSRPGEVSGEVVGQVPGEPPAAAPALPLYRFIERTPAGAEDTPGVTAIVDRRALWPMELGRRQRVLAEPSAVDHRRPVLIRAYVATPVHAPGSLRLHVDEQVFTALPLSPVEVLTVAVPPGAHEVMLEAPAGTEAFLSATPEDPAAQRGRIRARRPAWDRGRAARLAVPADQAGMPVRVTLRVALAEGAHGPEPVRVRLRTDTGHTRSIAIEAGTLDTSWVPMDGAAPVSAAVRAVLWLPPDARWLWLEPEQPGDADGVARISQIWASLAVRQPGRQPGSESPARADAPDEVLDRAQELDDDPQPAAGAAPAQVVAPGDPAWSAIVSHIAELSRALLATPDDASLRLLRAHRLLDLGEVGRVAMDWDHLAALPPERLAPDQAAMRERLAHRLADWRDPLYLPVQPRPLEQAVALAPASMALMSDPAPLADWQPAALAARQGDRTQLDATARDRDTLLARYYRAEILLREGAHARAATELRDIYEQTGALAIGVEALLAFESALAGHPDDDSAPDAPAAGELASLAYGLALGMRERFAHPVVRRVLFAAARRSRWEPLRGAEGSAGFESIHVDEELLDPEPDALLERALLAPPWPREQAGVVHPGRAALLSLSLRAPARIQAEAWCQRIRPAEGEARPACAVRWRVTGKPEQSLDVPLAQVTRLGTAALARGRHELEVVLADQDPTVRLVVRFTTSRAIAGEAASSGAAVAVLRPGRMHVADAQHPVTATVLGPTTIRVEARRYMDEPPVVLVAEARSVSEREPEAVLERQVRVDAGQDPSALGDAPRDVRLSGASTTVLVLPAATAYRVTLRPRDGRALVRLWHRRDVPGAPEEAPPAQDTGAPLPSPGVNAGVNTGADPGAGAGADPPALPALVAWPAAIEPGTGVLAASWQPGAPSPWPTLSAGLSFRRDDLADRDIEDEPLENRLQLDLAWRRQLVPERFWLRVESALRWHPVSPPAYGATVDLAWRRLPLGLRLDVMSRAFAQFAADTLAWTAQGRARVGRAFRLQPALTLVPALAVQARVYSLDAAPAGAVVDPLVYNDYDRAHRFGLRPEANLYWRPLQDQIGFAGARLVTNEDFYSPDRAELELGWRGLAPWQRIGFPVLELRYRPGYRFEDAGRSRGYMRHDLGVRLDWSLWNGSAGRWLLEVRDEAYLSTGWGNRNVFLIGLRYDAVDGRGLRDMLPIEYRFDELIEPPPWAD